MLGMRGIAVNRITQLLCVGGTLTAYLIFHIFLQNTDAIANSEKIKVSEATYYWFVKKFDEFLFDSGKHKKVTKLQNKNINALLSYPEQALDKGSNNFLESMRQEINIRQYGITLNRFEGVSRFNPKTFDETEVNIFIRGYSKYKMGLEKFSKYEKSKKKNISINTTVAGSSNDCIYTRKSIEKRRYYVSWLPFYNQKETAITFAYVKLPENFNQNDLHKVYACVYGAILYHIGAKNSHDFMMKNYKILFHQSQTNKYDLTYFSTGNLVMLSKFLGYHKIRNGMSRSQALQVIKNSFDVIKTASK